MRDNDQTAPSPSSPIDWEQVARAALANGASKGAKKVNRRNLAELCQLLADGIPLDMAARKLGIQPQSIRAWAETRPAAWRLIEQARSHGEMETVAVIKSHSDWKAAAYRLGLQRPEYREGYASQNSGGPQISITLSVPVPQLVKPGERPIVDITPAADTQPIVSVAAPRKAD